MRASRRRGSSRRRTGLSSVYGFVMIYLLVIASLQVISTSLSSSEGAMAAAQQAGQIDQMRSLEHLRVREAQGGNVTVTNDGLITSVLSALLLAGKGGSVARPIEESVPVGGSVDLGVGSASAVAVVTSLGNVFASARSGQAGGSATLAGAIGGPGLDAQLYQNSADPSRFFVAEGSSVSAFSSHTGARLWSFQAGEGEITDVLPLSDGGLYVSDGYYGDQFTSNLFRLSSSGTSLADYSMRLLRLYTTVEVQFPSNSLPPYPVGSQPVEKGADSLFAYYDGWFFSSAGPSTTSVPSDTYNLAASDSQRFYLFIASANPGGYGCTAPHGNQVAIYGYSADSQGVKLNWSTPVYFNICNLYPDDLLGSSAGSGVVACLFSETYWSQPNYFGGPYPGSNPLLAVLASSTGDVLRSGPLDSNGYTGMATDGSHVYLSIPSSQEVEVLGASGNGGGTFYDVGIPASTLLWAGGHLFAIAPSQVKVYDSSMTLTKTIDFSPTSFYSLSNAKQLEPQMVRPSFLVLNSTTYVALLRNSTGYGTLVVGAYSP